MTVLDLSKTVPAAWRTSPDGPAVDVCIIGSGAGGATAAQVLAEAGLDVLVLEEGADRSGEALTQRDAEMYDQLYMDRGGRSSEDMSVSVLQGRVLGGGPVINACDVVPMSDGVLAHWRRRFGLNDLTEEALAPHRAWALETLSAGRIRDSMLNQANRLLQAGAEAIGVEGEAMMDNRRGCAELGSCLIGCPIRAKQSTRQVQIPRAAEAGARFAVRARVVRIEGADREVKRVRIRRLDAQGYHERGELVVRAPVVIVAANAVNTPQLLLRSGIGNDHVGRHLMLQPQLPVLARFPDRVDAWHGIPQAYAVTEFEEEAHPEHGLWGYRIEAIMGTPGIVATLLPFVGAASKRAMTDYSHFAASLLLAPDRPSGRVKLDGHGRPVVAYEQRNDHRARLRHAVRTAARAYLAAGAREVLVPTMPPLVLRSEADLGRVDDLSLAPATAPLLSAHQQGTVRMAPSERDGAAAPDGRVYGTRDVFVLDSSTFPSSASSHIMTPIMTLAHLQANRLGSNLLTSHF
ncbi:MAG: GMC family oxidoreductase N-terminal domain-containing protein [Myxococcota bacterium]